MLILFSYFSNLVDLLVVHVQLIWLYLFNLWEDFLLSTLDLRENQDISSLPVCVCLYSMCVCEEMKHASANIIGH